MSTKWRIYCTTEIGWVEIWSDTPPTECPNNAGHTVNSNSVQELDVSEELLRIHNNKSDNNSNFTRLLKFHYNPITNGVIRHCRAIIYKSGNMTDFTVEIFDATNQNEMLNTNVSNEVEETIVDLGLLSNVPTSSAIIEVSMKRNGGNNNSKFYLDEIIFYS